MAQNVEQFRCVNFIWRASRWIAPSSCSIEHGNLDVSWSGINKLKVAKMDDLWWPFPQIMSFNILLIHDNNDHHHHNIPANIMNYLSCSKKKETSKLYVKSEIHRSFGHYYIPSFMAAIKPKTVSISWYFQLICIT